MFEGVELRQMPLTMKSVRTQVESFLHANDLLLDNDLDYYAGLFLDDEMMAGGGLSNDIIKCIAVSANAREMNLSGSLISHLRSAGMARGYSNLYAFTKPQNRELFEHLAFNVIAESPKAILCESSSHGIETYCRDLKKEQGSGVQGCIVMNCNPVTLGHLYLIETAASQVDRLHIICVQEDASLFPYEVRYNLLKQATSHLDNVVVHRGSRYVLSKATFPSYFIKEPSEVALNQIKLDLDLFVRYIVPALNITVRFVGTEPLDVLTNNYNTLMKEMLPNHGVRVEELQRKEDVGGVISASRVRQLLADDRIAEASQLLPPCVVEFLGTEQGSRVVERIKKSLR